MYAKETTMRRHGRLFWTLWIALTSGIVLLIAHPSFWIYEGMTFEEVGAVLGRPDRGFCMRVIEDAPWTARFPAWIGIVEVSFDGENTVRESPNFARRALRRFGL
jgi:hypothetical protein